MSILDRLDSPFTWAAAGFGIGLGLGVNTASAWLVTAGLVGTLVYLHKHGPAERDTEGRLFASMGAFLMAWLAGFVVHGWAF